MDKIVPEKNSLYDQNSFFIRLGPRFEELRAEIEGGNLSALSDAIQLAKDSGFKPRWIQKELEKHLIDSLKYGGLPPKMKKVWDKQNQAQKRSEQFRVFQQLRRAKVPLSRVCTEASKLLEGTVAEGSEEAIRKAVKRVSKERKDPKRRNVHYPMSRETRHARGLPPLPLPKVSK